LETGKFPISSFQFSVSKMRGGMEEGKRGLSVTSLALLFLLGVGVCAVFFALGFLLGYKERLSDNTAAVERVTPSGDVPPVVNPPPEKEDGLRHDAASVPAGPVAAQPTVESGQKSQSVASAANPSVQDAGSGAGPAAAQGAGAAPGNPDASETLHPAPTKQPATGGIALQVAALQSIDDAKRLVKVLEERGYPVFLVTPAEAQANDNLFRVRVGPFTLRDEAEKTRQKLVTEGFKPFVRR
jgi:DedD protein